jgi:hypothetical protein
MPSRHDLEHCLTRRRANDLGVRGLSGFGEGAFGHRRHGRTGGRTAQDACGPGKAVECGARGPFAAAPAASELDDGDRLASGALLRTAQAQPQRDVLRQAATGNHKLPCLRHRLHCLLWVRYTVAVTWVRRHETTVTALNRLVATIRAKGLQIQRLLLDRAFFNVPVVHLLQEQQIPFVMPVMFRGRAPTSGGDSRVCIGSGVRRPAATLTR